MATRQAYKRLTREYKNIESNPVPYITAKPDESNILVWHYIIDGPPDTPYHGGQYHGTLTFPSDYPFKPPAIRMFTPSGRFQSGMRLCLSISDYHPKTWNPAWSTSTILTGLLSFMVSDEVTAGSISGTPEKRKQFAKNSRIFNNQSAEFCKQFPEMVKENVAYMAEQATKADSEPSNSENGDTSISSETTTGNTGGLKVINLNKGNKNTNGEVVAANEKDSIGKNRRGMSITQKAMCAAVLLVSWVVASRLFS